MKIQKPTIGRVIAAVRDDTPIEGEPLRPGWVTLRGVLDQQLRSSIAHAAFPGKPNTWHYPPPVKDEIEVPE